MYWSVKKVKALKNHQLELTFENHVVKIFDVNPYLDLGVFQKLKNEKIFGKARILFGTVSWPGGIDIDPETLYEDGVIPPAMYIAEECAVYEAGSSAQENEEEEEKEMSILSTFFGITVRMGRKDVKQYPAPHIHVEYQEATAVYDIESGDLLAGKLPRKQHIFVGAWIEIRKEDLMTNWMLAEAEHPLLLIRGLS